MSDTSVNRSFRFSLGTLLSVAQRLLGALNDGTLATPMVDHLSATFVTDFTDQLALVAKLSNHQSTAAGLVNALTFSQGEARRDFNLLSSSARRAGQLAFTGQDALLHSEFQVGSSQSKGLADVIHRGQKLVTACQTHATDLSVQGWLPAATAKLQAALDVLTDGRDTHETAKDGKEGLTAECVNAANKLYRQCAAVQNAARVVYAQSKAALDPGTVEARGRFLLGQFPPRPGAKDVVAPAVPAGPVVPATPAEPHGMVVPGSAIAAQEVLKAA